MPKSSLATKPPATASAQSRRNAAAAARANREGLIAAVHACESKKAAGITLLELEKGSSAFTDYFVICSGNNPRQIQAISDEVRDQLAQAGMRPTHVEGYNQAEWVLLDYVDFVVHVFSENARKFYDLERLWKSARKIEPGALKASGASTRARGMKSATKKPAARKRSAPAHKKVK